MDKKEGIKMFREKAGSRLERRCFQPAGGVRNEKRRGTGGVKRRGEWEERVAKETGEMKEREERGVERGGA